jgi:FtsP/CotA-like multicopper oxidase with cupredoxin domain
MKKKLLPVITAVALLAMPVGQAVAANKPTPPASSSGGQMHMSASQMSAAQPAMSGWDMVKMRTTAKMRAKAARNAALKGKPAQAVAATTFDTTKGPDYFGTTPNYASSPMPRLTWKAVSGHAAGDLAILPVYDPATGQLSDPVTKAVLTVAQTPYAPDLTSATVPVADPITGIVPPVDPTTATRPLLDPINQIPQLDYAKVSIAGGIRKFVEPLPGLGAAATGSTMKNYANLQAPPTTSYIPVATPDTTTYPGSDYYEIGLKDYYQTFSPDLPPTKLRGYYQKNAPNAADRRPFYLGPIIVANANRPVRVKFRNELAKGAGGDLFLPVDTTAMGAGTGPDGTTKYGQNRAVIHLHGGLTPWISDGTPNQWTTPVGDTSKYPKGVSVYGVPDMPGVSNSTTSGVGNDGSLTFYYTNKQSARLMWYHDHAYGLTRLNVYAGEVSGYVLDAPLTDPTKAKSVANPLDPNDAQTKFDALLPADSIPLVIQDKAFVPDDIPSGYFPNGQLTDTDPTWNRTKWGGPAPRAASAPGTATDGALWFPHVYMPNQNPYDNSGANAMGRWDYGPWFWPIFGTSAGLVHGEIANPYASAAAPWEPPFIPGTPSTYTKALDLASAQPSPAASDVSLVPEAFVDTPVINGVAYPYMTVKPQAYRFRILNGANDRYWNLQMYCSAADKPASAGLYTTASTAPMWASSTDRVPANPAAGEVPMVQAVRTAGYPAEWPTDGRDGGVPDPAAAAGGFMQIGTEGGVLPAVADVPNQPVNYVYNRRDIIVLSIDTHALLLGPAERADVIYDFSAAKAKGCQNVILYNDAPTPVPAFDPRNDYYTNNPNQTDSGGTPSTLPGYGPNTRTLMQFRIAGVSNSTFNANAVRTALPGTFAAVQHKPIVPAARYNAAYPGDPIGAGGVEKNSVYSRIQDTSVNINASQVGDVAKLSIVNAGSGYGPTATAAIAPPGVAAELVPVIDANGGISSIAVKTGGRGYPKSQRAGITSGGIVVTVSRPNIGTAATARASTDRNGVITSVRVDTPGTFYTAGATLTIAAPVPSPAYPNGNQATGAAVVDLNTGRIGAVTLTDVGNGYSVAPNVEISAPLYDTGVQATASSTLSSNATGGSTVRLDADPKAVQELFEMDYGRMNATLGVELPFTNSLNQTTLPMGYTEPVTEFLKPSQVGTQIGTSRDGTAIWKITHNGVDTHTIHFHLMDVQLINRVGWDGAIRPPDDNEIGWKESVRMNPLEDAIVAMRPATPDLPFKIGESVRSIDPTMPANHQMSAFDPLTGQVISYSNKPVNMGWEYVWHCHLLGHEENDMMRPVDFAGSPDAPTLDSVEVAGAGVDRTITAKWTNNANWQLTNFVVQRATNAKFTGAVQTLSDKDGNAGVVGYTNWQGAANALMLGAVVQKTAREFVDPATDKVIGTTYYYRVRAESAQGYSQWSAARSVTF